VAVRAARRLGLDVVLVGELEAMRAQSPDLPVVHALNEGTGPRLLAPPPGAEPVEVRAVRWGAQACAEGRGRALVTGPIHKARLAAAGFVHTGHTDLLGAMFGVDPVMAFVGGAVRVALVTVHIPLQAVSAAVTVPRVLHTLRVTDRALRTQLGLQAPRLAVCGLNPHAGDGGVLGREELEVIGPAVAAAREEGIDARGPISAETAFAEPDASDLVVAMYHDQGLVPLKWVDFGRTVNWTLGLPIVRTSVDHGTADALVGTGRARSDSMEAALRLAVQLTPDG